MTTVEDNVPGGKNLAQHIADALKNGNQEAVAVGPIVSAPTAPAIPPHIAGNLLEFLRRVESKGMEAVAWVEAYQFVQKHVPQQPGAVGLPPSPK